MQLNYLYNFRDPLYISAATQNNKNIGYQPARPLDTITFQTVCQAVENSLKIEARVQDSAEMDLIEKTLEDQNRSSQGNDFKLNSLLS